MADCPVHGVPHRGCDMGQPLPQVEAVVDAIEADDLDGAGGSKLKAKADDA